MLYFPFSALILKYVTLGTNPFQLYIAYSLLLPKYIAEISGSFWEKPACQPAASSSAYYK